MMMKEWPGPCDGSYWEVETESSQSRHLQISSIPELKLGNGTECLLVHDRAVLMQARSYFAWGVGMALGGVFGQLDADAGCIGDD